MSFVYEQDGTDKAISHIPGVDFSQSHLSVVDVGSIPVKLESYTSLYPQSIKLASEDAAIPLNSQQQYANYSKEANGHQPEPHLPCSPGIMSSSIAVSSHQSPPIQGFMPEITSRVPMLISAPSISCKTEFRTVESVVSHENEYCFDGSGSPRLAASHSKDSLFHKNSGVNGTVGVVQTSQVPSSNASTETSLPPPSKKVLVSGPRANTVGETLFVSILVSRCKRIAPLWFRGISSMRERNREENRRTSTNASQTQNDWSIISGKIREMNKTVETDTVINLLKKLHKELPPDSILKFIKCWLGDADALHDRDSCVLSRADAKGRMRRIDGGKGSDKVWRLDTIVGMLYHGLPMSSTDTNIMVHTCGQELCVRPQHIRFRASSVALVIVLKALEQAGYTITPPSPRLSVQPPDEAVDVFGPFSIEELQQYRSENLSPAGESLNRVPLNATDRELAESLCLGKEALHRKGSSATSASSLPASSVITNATSSELAHNAATSSNLSQSVHLLNGGGDVVDIGLADGYVMETSALFTTTTAVTTAGIQTQTASSPHFPPTGPSASVYTISPIQSHSVVGQTKRRSMKRPAQSPPTSLNPPPVVSVSSSTLPDANVFLSVIHDGDGHLMMPQQQQQQQQQLRPTVNQHLSAQIGEPPQQLPTHFTTQPAATLIVCNPQASTGQPPPTLYAPQPIGPSSVPAPAPPSGKSTPRQPAKKRLEARTPTIDELIVPSAFKVLHDTPFTPVLGRTVGTGHNTGCSLSQASATPLTPSNQPSLVSSKPTPTSSSTPSRPSRLEEDEDEEMKTIFAGPGVSQQRGQQPPASLSSLASAVEYKHLQKRLHCHYVASAAASASDQAAATATESPNSIFFRSTSPAISGAGGGGGGVCNGKRCASACTLPSLSPCPLTLTQPGQLEASDIRQMPSLVPAETGFSSPPLRLSTTSTTPSGGGRHSKSNLFDRDTPHSWRNFASQFRDSPISHMQPDILEVLVSLAQEYGVQSNGAGGSCSRPQSQQYLHRSFFPGTDSPSPVGLSLNMLNSSGGGCMPGGAVQDLLGDSQQPPPPPPNFPPNPVFVDLSPGHGNRQPPPLPSSSSATADFNQ